MITNLKAHTTIKLLIITVIIMNHIQLLLSYNSISLLTSSLSSCFLHCLPPSLFRWRHDGSSSRLSSGDLFHITVDLDSSPFVGVHTPGKKTTLSSFILYLILDLPVFYFWMFGFWTTLAPHFLCPNSSQKDSLSPVTFSPSWSHFCCILTQVWWTFSVLLLRQSWFV